MIMEGWHVLEQARELSRLGEPFALATVVWRQGPSSAQQGCRAIVTATGEMRGWIGGACAEPAVLRQARQVLETGESRLLLLGGQDELGSAREGVTTVAISCQSEGALEVFVEPVLPAPHLLVIGDSPMASTLVEMARAIDWRTELAEEIDTAAMVTERSMVVIATQGHNDEACLEQALAARPAYVGLVGSRKRGKTVLGYLADRGFAREDRERVHVPAGIDLGRTSHREIAVAILAELVGLRAAGELPVPLTGSQRSVAPPSTEALDPVCGMTVDVASAGDRFDHEGTTYYFCRAGCRQAFENDPSTYLKETRC